MSLSLEALLPGVLIGFSNSSRHPHLDPCGHCLWCCASLGQPLAPRGLHTPATHLAPKRGMAGVPCFASTLNGCFPELQFQSSSGHTRQRAGTQPPSQPCHSACVATFTIILCSQGCQQHWAELCDVCSPDSGVWAFLRPSALASKDRSAADHPFQTV